MSIYLIRHGESLSNAGAATSDFIQVPLTDKGHLQAQMVANALKDKPDFIITSKFLRAKQTAQPIINKFPDVPVLERHIGEHDYLALPIGKPMTLEERKPLVKAYWDKADPYYQDGLFVESFRMFINRIEEFLTEMKQQRGNVYVFSHGKFLQGLFLTTLGLLKANPDSMNLFCRVGELMVMGNCEYVKLDFINGLPKFSNVKNSHLKS